MSSDEVPKSMWRNIRATQLRFGLNRVEVFVVLSIIALMLALIVPSLDAARRARSVSTIPEAEPYEDRRLYLPSGCSIIKPPHWDVETILENELRFGGFEFHAPIQNKPGASLWVYWTKGKRTPMSDAVDIQFQGRSAWLKTERQEPKFMLARGQFKASISAPRDECAIEISYIYYGDQPAIPEMIWKYLETVAGPSNAARPTP